VTTVIALLAMALLSLVLLVAAVLNPGGF